MRLRFTLAPQVCLYLGLSISGNAAGVSASDVPASLRNSNELHRKPDATDTIAVELTVLERARSANTDVYDSLQSFVCNEQMNRFTGKARGESARALDTISAKLSFERGVEQYSNVFQNNHQRASIASLSGAWSEGEFGTLLLQTKQLLSAQQVTFDDFTNFRGERVAIYNFDVASEGSPWDLNVASHHYRLPFHTRVWISADTGEIRKIERTSVGMPPQTHIGEIQWIITLDHVTLNGTSWLLPANGTYSVLYTNTNHREWNLISFTGYQRYGAQTALKFE